MSYYRQISIYPSVIDLSACLPVYLEYLYIDRYSGTGQKFADTDVIAGDRQNNLLFGVLAVIVHI